MGLNGQGDGGLGVGGGGLDGGERGVVAGGGVVGGVVRGVAGSLVTQGQGKQKQTGHQRHHSVWKKRGKKYLMKSKG